MLLIGLMVGIAFRLELTIFGLMYGPRLVHWSPKVILIVYFFGFGLSIFWFLLFSLLFPFSVLVLFSRWFLTLDLAFSFSFTFTYSRGDVLKLLDRFRLLSLILSTTEARDMIFSCSRYMEFPLLSFLRILNLFKAEVISSSGDIL